MSSVRLGISDTGGQTIESGATGETPARSGRCIYIASQAVVAGATVRIGVIAMDRPKHKGEAEKEKTLKVTGSTGRLCSHGSRLIISTIRYGNEPNRNPI